MTANLRLLRFLQARCSKVYITSRSQDECEAACKALNALRNKRPDAVAYAIQADVSKATDIDRLYVEISKTTDHIDILFTNAGTTWGAPFDNYSEDGLTKVYNLNVKGVFLSIQKCVEYISLIIAFAN